MCRGSAYVGSHARDTKGILKETLIDNEVHMDIGLRELNLRNSLWHSLPNHESY